MYVLYGVDAPDLESAAALINDALNIVLQQRESGVIGDYYRLRMPDGEKLTVRSKTGYDQEDEYQTEPDFPAWNVFAYVDNTRADSALLAKLEANWHLFKKLRVDS